MNTQVDHVADVVPEGIQLLHLSIGKVPSLYPPPLGNEVTYI